MLNQPKSLAFVRGSDDAKTVAPYIFHDGNWAPVLNHPILATIQYDKAAYVPKGGAAWMREFTALVNAGYTAKGVYDSVQALPLMPK